MKHKLKKILLLYLLGGMFFVSCSLEDEYLKQDNSNHKIKIERKTFHELLKEEKFNAAYSKISKQKNPISSSVLGRTVMEAEYDFTISNIPAKVITYGNNISYSFHINRNASNSNYFENLVVKVDSTTIPKAYIIKYVLNSNPIFISAHNAYTLDAQTEITQINYNDTEAKIEYYDGCAVVTLWCPYDGPHPAGPKCLNQRFDDLYWVRDTSGCGDDLDSGGGGSSGPVDTTGGGGGTGGIGDLDTPHNDSGNNNPIVTAPVLELEEDENILPKDPCEELKKLLKPNDSIIRPIIGEPDTIKRPKLKTRIELIGGKIILPNEYGCTFSYQKFGDKYTQGPIEGGEALTVALNVNGFVYGGMHSHSYEKCHSIPSFGDMDWIADCHYLAKDYNKDKVFEIIAVTKSDSITIPPEVTYYAFKVNDINILKQKIEQRINDIKPTTLSRDEKIAQIHIEDGSLFDKNLNELEKIFLEKYENYGLNLYKANQELTNWGKLTLNSIGNVENNPCGN